MGYSLALDLVQAFLAADFSGDERFRRRLDKISTLES
jgi:ribose 5-phosphate isomerase RpiB